MPLYEYYCKDCKTSFELIVAHQHADDVVCTKCHGEKVRRKLSLFATHRGDDVDYDYDEALSSPAGSCGCGGDCGCH